MTTILVSQRGARPHVARTGGFQFEDIVASLTGATVVAPTPAKVTRTVEKALLKGPRLPHRVRSTGLRYHGGRTPAHIDFLFAFLQFPKDAMTLDAITGWRKRTGLAICFVEEVWNKQILERPEEVRPLAGFDHIFCASWACVEPLQEATGVPTSFLPYGVDTLMFAPTAPAPDRSIDVLNMGRRSERTHASILEWARRNQRFYHFDTFEPGRPMDHLEHRWHLSQLLQRSKYFLAHPGKLNSRHEIGDQEELSLRWFEALSTGTIVLGQPPRTPIFGQIFDWEDVYFDAPYDDEAVPELIETLEEDPDRLASIRRRNLSHALHEFDVLHRWNIICSQAGIPEPAGGPARQRKIDRRIADLELTPPLNPLSPV